MNSGCRLPILSLAFLAAAAGCGGDDVTGPEPPPGAIGFSTITAGYFHTCGLTPPGLAYCWGGNTWGTLGDGTSTPSDRPVAVVGGHRFEAIDSGGGHTCGVTSSGQIFCWGLNDEGQVGYDFAQLAIDEPRLLPGSQTWQAVSAGHAHSCGLTVTGAAWCWGDNLTGQLGSGDTFQKSFEPVRVAASMPFESVLAGYYQSCGLTEDGRMYCWGRNDAGQIGDGSTSHRFTPVPVAGDLVFRTLAVGDAFVCGVTDGDATFCWGSNRNGEIGDPDRLPATTPVEVQGAPVFTSLYGAGGAWTVGTARAYACGLTAVGEAWCWGGPIRANPWDGPTEGPVRVAAGIRFRGLALGSEHLCGVTIDGWAFCAGGNYAGQLGDGTAESRSSMVGVVGR